jgi:SynChlorMet cassette radical SAM/SPASM protein ScmE
MRTPREVDIEITSRCNLRCRYCSFFGGAHPIHEDLPTASWIRFFEECGRAGVMRVSFAGGEPFIREDLAGLLTAVVDNRMRFTLLSNGMLIDDRHAAFIASTGRCDHVQVSVDAARAMTHDVFRGAGGFEGALRGVRTLQRHRVPVTVRVTIHRHNVAELETTVRFLLQEMGVPAISTNAAGFLGSCRERASEVLLTPEQRSRAMACLGELSERFPGRITAQAGPLAELQRWAEMDRARRDGDDPFPDGGRLTGCGCAWSRVAVRPDGTYVPCAMLPELELGRINDDRLDAVWRDSPLLLRLRLRQSVELASFEECRRCGYRPYCTGNCPGLAYSLTGEVDRPSPDACLARFLREGGTLPNSRRVEVASASRVAR